MKSARWMPFATAALLLLGGPCAPAAQTRPSTSDQAIHLYQRLLLRGPGDARAYFRLGDAYIQKARESGDVTYFNLAEQALRRSLAIAPDQSGALRHLAYVLYWRHDFDEAARQALSALALDPTDSHASGILGDAYLEVGKYEHAQAAYDRMAGRDLYTESRRAGLKSLRGDVEGALQDLERAIAAGKASGRPPESIAWVEWQLGNEHLALGHIEAAEAGYLAALATFANYHRALAGLGQVRTAQRRFPEAVDFYQKAIAIIPQPDYVAALGDVYAKLGRPAESQKQYALIEYIGRLNALNQVLYNRELASFYADHDTKLPEALELARRELEVRRDIYGYDILAWALYKNGKPRDARAAMAEALKLGTRDARLLFHAGMIERELGETEAAATYLRRALTTNGHFHIFQADEAERVLQQLGHERTRTAGRETGDDQ